MLIPRRAIICLSIVLLFSFIALQQWEKGSLQASSVRVGGKKLKHKKQHQDNKQCSQVCLERISQHCEQNGGRSLLNFTDMTSLLLESRRELDNRLKRDYGEENFSNIFLVNGTESRGRRAFLSASGKQDGISTQRFKRKLKIKILEMQQAVRNELNSNEYDLMSTGDCTCVATSDSDGELQSNRRRLSSDNNDFYSKFVWATGGHSAAAGHGNLFNESYTAYLSRAITPTFQSIGIDFEGRNHAMGATPSAPEISLCQEAVFGIDADVQTYDYGMTDAGKWQKKVMYDERIAVHSNRPALLEINILVEDSGEHETTIRREEDRGLTVLYLDPKEFGEIKNAFPDTFGKNQAQIDAMPPMVRNFRCRDTFEKGDPFCEEKKYDNDQVCPDRGMMASWHPGYKMMALWGNTFALFLSDMLIDAVAELGSVGNQTNLLSELRREEENDYNRFLNSATTKDSTDFDLVPKDSDLVGSANTSIFFTEPTICRTARLPSQARYLGIMSGTPSTNGDVSDYFKGIPLTEATNLTSDKTATIPMPLVYDESKRQTCEIELNRDYSDYFYASNKMGWTSITFPNDAETQEYVKEAQKLRGILVLCLFKCDWSECPDGEMREADIVNGQTKMEVNGQQVVNVTNLIDDCVVLRGKEGHQWKPNDKGQYELRSRVFGNSTDFAYLRISSLVLL